MDGALGAVSPTPPASDVTEYDEKWLPVTYPNMRLFVDFDVVIACNPNAFNVCEIKFTYLLT